MTQSSSVMDAMWEMLTPGVDEEGSSYYQERNAALARERPWLLPAISGFSFVFAIITFIVVLFQRWYHSKPAFRRFVIHNGKGLPVRRLPFPLVTMQEREEGDGGRGKRAVVKDDAVSRGIFSSWVNASPAPDMAPLVLLFGEDCQPKELKSFAEAYAGQGCLVLSDCASKGTLARHAFLQKCGKGLSRVLTELTSPDPCQSTPIIIHTFGRGVEMYCAMVEALPERVRAQISVQIVDSAPLPYKSGDEWLKDQVRRATESFGSDIPSRRLQVFLGWVSGVVGVGVTRLSPSRRAGTDGYAAHTARTVASTAAPLMVFGSEEMAEVLRAARAAASPPTAETLEFVNDFKANKNITAVFQLNAKGLESDGGITEDAYTGGDGHEIDVWASGVAFARFSSKVLETKEMGKELDFSFSSPSTNSPGEYWAAVMAAMEAAGVSLIRDYVLQQKILNSERN